LLPNPLLTLTEARPSPIHGLGIFAKTDIPAGTIWWRGSDTNLLHIHRTQYETLIASTPSPVSRGLIENVHTYCYYSAERDALLLILDNARYTNHSPRPNSEILREPGAIGSVTIRDIRAGEEILEDYSSYDTCPWSKLQDTMA